MQFCNLKSLIVLNSVMFTTEPPVSTNPCDPSPCGPYSRCLVSPQGFATCSCLPGYRGAPPVCAPECVISSDCLQTSACVNQHCTDPCPGTCGIGARCAVINHNPICSCPPGYVGDPFVSCQKPKEPGESSYCSVESQLSNHLYSNDFKKLDFGPQQCTVQHSFYLLKETVSDRACIWSL